jgi:hypothetical protein
MPPAGRSADIAPLPGQALAGPRLRAQRADWPGDPEEAPPHRRQADPLARTIRKRFWRDGVGMLHTLNQVQTKWEPLVVLPIPESIENEFRRKWFRLPSIGPSGPSRHSQALAVMAGLVTGAADREAVLQTLTSSNVTSTAAPTATS